jgi:hypothetical protein
MSTGGIIAPGRTGVVKEDSLFRIRYPPGAWYESPCARRGLSGRDQIHLSFVGGKYGQSRDHSPDLVGFECIFQ